MYVVPLYHPEQGRAFTPNGVTSDLLYVTVITVMTVIWELLGILDGNFSAEI